MILDSNRGNYYITEWTEIVFSIQELDVRYDDGYDVVSKNFHPNLKLYYLRLT